MAKDTARLSDFAFSLESLSKRDDRFLRFTRLIDSVKRSRTLQNTEPTPNTTELFPSGTTFEDGCRLFLSSARQYNLGFGAKIRRRRDSVNWLGKQFSPAQAGWLMDFILADHPDPATARLPDLATILPSEEWPVFIQRALADGREGPRLAASGLLERSEHPDRTFVQCCRRSAIAANDMYPACAMLDVLKRFRMIDLVPEVELAYRDATYSYGGRLRAVETLEALAPSLFCERYARECLWDCEQLIIEIGCRHVDLDALDVRPRLEFLCDAFEDDPDEESQSFVQAARGRLGN